MANYKVDLTHLVRCISSDADMGSSSQKVYISRTDDDLRVYNKHERHHTLQFSLNEGKTRVMLGFTVEKGGWFRKEKVNLRYVSLRDCPFTGRSVTVVVANILNDDRQAIESHIPDLIETNDHYIRINRHRDVELLLTGEQKTFY